MMNEKKMKICKIVLIVVFLIAVIACSILAWIKISNNWFYSSAMATIYYILNTAFFAIIICLAEIEIYWTAKYFICSAEKSLSKSIWYALRTPLFVIMLNIYFQGLRILLCEYWARNIMEMRGKWGLIEY